jgi:hypothetical protein
MATDRFKVMAEATSKVFVVTELYEFVGTLHLINLDRRESDVLNDEKPFIHLTGVSIKDKKTGKNHDVPFAAINKKSIICVIPLQKQEKTRK